MAVSLDQAVLWAGVVAATASIVYFVWAVFTRGGSKTGGRGAVRRGLDLPPQPRGPGHAGERSVSSSAGVAVSGGHQPQTVPKGAGVTERLQERGDLLSDPPQRQIGDEDFGEGAGIIDAGSEGEAAIEVAGPTSLPGGSVFQNLPQLGASIARAAAVPRPDIIALVDLILSSADDVLASDLHLEPTQDLLGLRFRIDGVLHDIAELPKDLESTICSRLKVMAKLSTYSRNVPLDGRFMVETGGHRKDARLSMMPTLHGEKAVVRLLHPVDQRFNLETLGMDGETLAGYESLTTQQQGIVYFAGPTGSGKTTTIYSTLRNLRHSKGSLLNIVSIEDPIEFDTGVFSQTQVDEPSGLTFARGLRSLLRQDPDVIMVGEIRDLETAEIAVQAGLTGHLILTSVHAESASGVFSRLINLGIEPFIIGSSTAGILSQRLVRRVCSYCRAPTVALDEDRRFLESRGASAEGMGAFMGMGCANCFEKGYSGRIGLFELMRMDDHLREMISRKLPTAKLVESAVGRGMRTMLADGLDKVGAGLTSFEELRRVI